MKSLTLHPAPRAPELLGMSGRREAVRDSIGGFDVDVESRVSGRSARRNAISLGSLPRRESRSGPEASAARSMTGALELDVEALGVAEHWLTASSAKIWGSAPRQPADRAAGDRSCGAGLALAMVPSLNSMRAACVGRRDELEPRDRSAIDSTLADSTSRKWC